MSTDKEIVRLEHDLLRVDDLLQLLRNLPDEDNAEILGCIVYVPTLREVFTDAAHRYIERSMPRVQALQGGLRQIDGGAS